MGNELKLPDYVLTKEPGRVTLLERKTGEKRSLPLRTEPKLIRRRSPARFLAAVVCLLFASFFSYVFLQSLFVTSWEMAILPAIMVLPILIKGAWNGRAAVLGYFAAFLAFAALRGGLGHGQVRLGIIFFGGGPISYESYSIVPASELMAAIFLGIVPYAVFQMVGQILVEFDVVIDGPGETSVIRVRHGSMAREILDFMRGEDAVN